MNPGLDARFGPIDLPDELAAGAGGGQDDDPDNRIFDTFSANTSTASNSES